MSALEELDRLGVTVELDKDGRAHFRARPAAVLPPAARRMIERQGDLIEAVLIEQAIAAFRREQESSG